MTALASASAPGAAPFWVGAVLDLAPAHHAAALAFWAGVTGYEVSDPRGRAGELQTLLPARGDDHLRVQRSGDGPVRVHLDLHVADARAAADAAVLRGATELAAPDDGDGVALRSPGGLPFCLVSSPASNRAEPAAWPGGRSVVDQVCLDVPPASYDGECAFWAATTGWELHESTDLPCFRSLARPEGQPLRLLLQRLDGAQPGVTAHLDLACDDRPAEVARHETLGARVVATHPWWTVLEDPTGTPYCVTDRDPDTGLPDTGLPDTGLRR